MEQEDDWDGTLDDYSYPESWTNNIGFIFSMLINAGKYPNLHPMT